MMRFRRRRKKGTAGRSLRLFVLAALIAIQLPPLFPLRVRADEPVKKVQIIQGEVIPHGFGLVYRVKDLKTLDRLYVKVHTETGNLDPLAALVSGDADVLKIDLAFNEAVNKAITEGRDPVAMLPDFADKHFIVWDDDSGGGYDAAFESVIPEDGDYKILVYPNPAHPNWGKFSLAVGVNEPGVLTGEAKPTGRDFVSEIQIFPPMQAVQEITGTVKAGAPKQFHIRPLKAGDTIYAYAETSAGGSPIIRLKDYGDKLLAVGFTTKDGQKNVTLQYTLKQDAENYTLTLDETGEGVESSDFRMLVGVNAPDVLTGQAQPTPGETVLQEPIPVQIGVKMDQITDVDQKSENFGVVDTLRMEWQDPKLAFDPATCDCKYKSLSISDFIKYAAAHGTVWPEFVYFNQQGRRDIQNGLVVVFSDGRAIYYERSTVTLQAPDFNFRLYPFDTQTFYIRIRQVFPNHLFTFTELPNFSDTGNQLGEEEWVIQEKWTEIEDIDDVSQFSFGFTANRHLMYYVVRIFVPVLIIIIVSWFTFFLKDYSKRVDVASANLLVFVAFNFTISDALPHLGYATILDLVLVTTFVITGVVVIFNVWLKRLEVTQKESIAQTIDKYSIWLYPILYFAAFALVAFFFTKGGTQ